MARTSALLVLPGVGAGSFVNRQVFTGAGSYTYTPTNNRVRTLIISVVGGGGAGGASAASTAGNISAGSGGGAGGFAQGIKAIAQNQTFAVVVGAGGASGSDGTASSFNTTDLVGNGGKHGGQLTNGSTIGTQVLGGTGSGGGTASSTLGNPVTQSGGQGFPAVRYTGALAMPGRGADSVLGTGGPANASSQNVVGSVGSGFGAGGSGAVSGNGQGANLGGAGLDGCVIIDEYT